MSIDRVHLLLPSLRVLCGVRRVESLRFAIDDAWLGKERKLSRQVSKSRDVDLQDELQERLGCDEILVEDNSPIVLEVVRDESTCVLEDEMAEVVHEVRVIERAPSAVGVMESSKLNWRQPLSTRIHRKV